MATVSVPLSDELLHQIEMLISLGIASNKADLIRRAVQIYLEEQAVQAVLQAHKEPRLEGDLDELASRISLDD